MAEVKKFMLIKADADKNNNKFWEAVLHDDDRVYCRWGRVGANGQSKVFNGGQHYIDKKIREKNKKGYKEARVTANTGGTSEVVGALKSVAKQQIKHSDCKVTANLIEFLVKVNAHQITTQSGGKLSVDIADGSIQLPSGMGVLTQDAIDDARDTLGSINKLRVPSKRGTKKFKDTVQDYLMLVPQDIGRTRGWIDTIFIDKEEVAKQLDLLDSLEATLCAITMPTASTSSKKKTTEEKVFDVELALLKDKKTAAKINQLFNKTRKQMHQSYGFKPKTIYSVHIAPMVAAFDKGSKVGNVKELWHGTKAANLLSILKIGLIIPKSHGSISVTGRAYGDGVYFSDQSTKSLNYASGYWGGGYNNQCFMFLADVAMGKEYTPKGYGSRFSGSCNFPTKGYDSTFAKAGQSGVSNNEMIVYNTNQCNLRYLVEFEG